MVRALQAAQPIHPAATSNLAAFLRLTGSYEAAERLLREALASRGVTALRVDHSCGMRPDSR